MNHDAISVQLCLSAGLDETQTHTLLTRLEGRMFSNAVGRVYTMEALVPGGKQIPHVQLYKGLPAGTEVYLAPQVKDPGLLQEFLAEAKKAGIERLELAHIYDESANSGQVEWEEAERITDLPKVDELLRAFVEEPTGDAGVEVVRAVMQAVKWPAQPVMLPSYKEIEAIWIETVREVLNISPENPIRLNVDMMAHPFARKLLNRYGQPAHQSVPDGWKLVPIKMNDAMIDAFYQGPFGAGPQNVYAAILANVPTTRPLVPAEPVTAPSDEQAAFTEWAEVEYRNEASYTARDYRMGLEAWKERARYCQASIHLQDLKNALAQAAELRQQITLMDEHAKGEVWRWQDDGTDSLETMGNRMGVLIYACDLRELLASQGQPAANAEPNEQKCRRAYDDFYHKIGAQVGYDHWCAIWRFISKRLATTTSNGQQEARP